MGGVGADLWEMLNEAKSGNADERVSVSWGKEHTSMEHLRCPSRYVSGSTATFDSHDRPIRRGSKLMTGNLKNRWLHARTEPPRTAS